MMLNALVDLAKQEKLLENPDVEKKRVDFVVRIGRDGRFHSLISRRDEKDRGEEILVPRWPKRAVNITPAFFFDSAKYVLGIDDPKKAKPARLQRCVAAFAALVEQTAATTGDASASAVAAFFASHAENVAAVLGVRPAAEWTGSENLAFSVEGLSGLAHEQPAIAAYWSELRKTEVSGSAGRGKKTKPVVTRCLVTGRWASAERLHPSIKGLTSVGGQSSGSSVVSFNAPSFESQGLQQGDNSPVCRDAAEAYATALNWLLERDPLRGGPRYGIRLGKDAISVFWTSLGVAPIDPLLALWEGPKPEEAEAFFLAPFKGLEPSDLDESRFFAMTIGANAARVVVRDWYEDSLGNSKRHMRQFFDDLAIQGADRPPTIWQLIDALDPPGQASLPPNLATQMYAACLKGTPLPRELLRHALLRLRTPPEKEKNHAALMRKRCAVMKAVLCGLSRVQQNKHLEVSMVLDEDNKQVPYLLGRLFAVLERLQGAALGDINVTIRDRFFGAASATPVLVFPHLMRLSVHHEAKAKESGRWLEKKKGEIMAALPAENFPSLLPLEEQTLFAVGYYHQRETFFVKKSQREGVAESR